MLVNVSLGAKTAYNANNVVRATTPFCQTVSFELKQLLNHWSVSRLDRAVTLAPLAVWVFAAAVRTWLHNGHLFVNSVQVNVIWGSNQRT